MFPSTGYNVIAVQVLVPCRYLLLGIHGTFSSWGPTGEQAKCGRAGGAWGGFWWRLGAENGQRRRGERAVRRWKMGGTRGWKMGGTRGQKMGSAPARKWAARGAGWCLVATEQLGEASLAAIAVLLGVTKGADVW
ncbi:hypothetical protein ABZP36_017317 [Zizania latifolia]